jgi:flagellar biosynthetic protein FlhB
VRLAFGTAFMLLAAVDYAWQRLRHEKSLKMTKEEVRQETRQSDLAPEVRAAPSAGGGSSRPASA